MQVIPYSAHPFPDKILISVPFLKKKCGVSTKKSSTASSNQQNSRCTAEEFLKNTPDPPLESPADLSPHALGQPHRP